MSVGVAASFALLVTVVAGGAGQPVSSSASQAVYQAVLADRRCSGVNGIRGSVPMIRRETVSPGDAFWAQALAGPFVDRLREMLPGASPSLLDEFARPRPAAVVSDETARALGTTVIAQAEVDSLLAKYPDAFAAWDALFRRFPMASALVELSPVSFNESANEALVYCAYTISPLGAEGSLVLLRRSEAATWRVVTWRQVFIS